jgi:uncharacterized membrane protein
MKVKHAFILGALGLCLELVGAVFKIQHWASADVLLILGLVLIIVGGLLLGYKLLTHPRVRNFLNW